jgi:hypothetical protein
MCGHILLKVSIGLTATSDEVDQLLAHGPWFSPGSSDSSTTKACRNDIAEILMKVALINKSNQVQKFQTV